MLSASLLVLCFSALELERSKNAEIAKHVILTEEALNIADLELDGRFGKGPVSRFPFLQIISKYLSR